ncbi:hypothetical protein I4U23_022356 [Adineta vaga]|nr:hypothetical protein I4U23_022356 [Adineta vaga]
MAKLLFLWIFLFYCGYTLAFIEPIREPRLCPHVLCKIFCPYGFAISDVTGCHYCQCNPCKNGVALKISCENDENICKNNGGFCTMGETRKKYCCQNKNDNSTVDGI